MSEKTAAPVTTAAVQNSAEPTILWAERTGVRGIVEGFPFEPEVDGWHSYVTFVAEETVLTELAPLASEAHEKIALGDGVIYWQIPKGDTLTSTVGKTMGNRRYAPSTTTRNLRTLSKVLR